MLQWFLQRAVGQVRGSFGHWQCWRTAVGNPRFNHCLPSCGNLQYNIIKPWDLTALASSAGLLNVKMTDQDKNTKGVFNFFFYNASFIYLFKPVYLFLFTYFYYLFYYVFLWTIPEGVLGSAEFLRTLYHPSLCLVGTFRTVECKPQVNLDTSCTAILGEKRDLYILLSLLRLADCWACCVNQQIPERLVPLASTREVAEPRAAGGEVRARWVWALESGEPWA